MLKNLILGGNALLTTRYNTFLIVLFTLFLVMSCSSKYYWIDDTRATSQGKKAHAKSMKAARKGMRKVSQGF